jgi:hypothetical protein
VARQLFTLRQRLLGRLQKKPVAAGGGGDGE